MPEPGAHVEPVEAADAIADVSATADIDATDVSAAADVTEAGVAGSIAETEEVAETAEAAEAAETAEAEEAEEADGPAPLGVEVRPTGHGPVDSRLRRLAEADNLTVSGHLEVYEDVHRGLRETLAELDQHTPGG